MDKLTLVIPAKYEKESLPQVLSELEKYQLNILIVLEETDVETIKSIKKFDCNILYQTRKGYGDALIQGIKNVKTDYFCIFNADGSFIPDELEGRINLIEKKNYDLVFGSRYEKNAKSEDDTIITYIGNKFFTLLGKLFFLLPITDILYTYVLGKTNKVNALNLKNKDFCFCVELPIIAKKRGLTLTSRPAHERKRFAGKKKVNAFKDGTKILLSMIKLFFSK